MRTVIALAILIQLGRLSYAQTAEQPNTIFKTSPFSILGWPLASFEVGVEHRLAPKWYLNHQAAVVFGTGWLNMPDFEQLEGYRWQSGIRHYLNLFDGQNMNPYFELHGKYSYTNMLIPADFCRFDCAFEQRINYQRLERSFSLLAAAGAGMFFSRRMKLDIDYGMGYQWLDRRYSNVPPDAVFITNGTNYYLYNVSDKKINRFTASVRLTLGFVLY